MPQRLEFRSKDGVEWRIGAQADVAWIGRSAPGDVAITAAIPPMFEDYATLLLPAKLGVSRDRADGGEQDRALLALLEAHSPRQPWWIGYLETGGSDVVFYDAPKVQLYGDWSYVLINAGPEQAASWRPTDDWTNWKSTELPDLMFPADRCWLASILWDDNFTCIGGSVALISDLLASPALGTNARRVTVEQDATPRGHGPR